MQVAWIGLGAFFIVSLGVGLRMLALAFRTGQAPELLIGVAVLGLGPIGFGLQALAPAGGRYGITEGLATAGAVVFACGVWAKLLFNWMVFRQGSRIALGVLVALALGVAAHLLAQALGGSFREAAQSVRLGIARGALQAAALGWGAGEAFAYWGRMRKRARIGLAEPALTNRFLLWAVAAGAAGLGSAVSAFASVASGRPPSEIPWVVASSSLHGFVAAIAMWLAFSPPRVYRAWLTRAHATT